MPKNNKIPTGGGVILLILVLMGLGVIQTAISRHISPLALVKSFMPSSESEASPRDWKKDIEQGLAIMVLEPLPPVRIEGGWRFRFQVKETPESIEVPNGLPFEIKAEFNLHQVGMTEEQGVSRFVSKGEVEVIDLALPPGRYVWSVRTHVYAGDFHSVAPWMPWVPFDNTPPSTDTPVPVSQAAMATPVPTDTTVELPTITPVIVALQEHWTPIETPTVPRQESTKVLTGLDALPNMSDVEAPPLVVEMATKTATPDYGFVYTPILSGLLSEANATLLPSNGSLEMPRAYGSCDEPAKEMAYKPVSVHRNANESGWIFEWAEMIGHPRVPDGVGKVRGPTATPIPCNSYNHFLLRLVGDNTREGDIFDSRQSACQVEVPDTLLQPGQAYEWSVQCLPKEHPDLPPGHWMERQPFTVP